MKRAFIILFSPLFLLLITSGLKPTIISSRQLLEHRKRGYHPECPERLSGILDLLESNSMVNLIEPSAIGSDERLKLAENAIRRVHSPEYVDEVKSLSERGATLLSPWDTDTYMNRKTFHNCLLAASAWIDGVENVVENSVFSFALTRPPGHHARFGSGMGFCIFNFAAMAATYALEKFPSEIKKVSILDYDVHFGNGVAELVADNPNIRYSSIHQQDIFPEGEGLPSERGAHDNILNIQVPGGTTIDGYLPLLEHKAIPFLSQFGPDLVIVCAGYDALASDDLAGVNLKPADYAMIAKAIKKAFGSNVLFGLEGGYSLLELPSAVHHTLQPFLSND